jgi:hypothetical protein
MQDEEHDIGYQDPNQEDMPSEMKDHMFAAFRHGAGLGPHPGKYTGPTRRKDQDPDDPTETHLDHAQQEEANARKMHLAQTGGSEVLGPTQMDQAQVKQRGALGQQAGLMQAQAAAKAQAAQQPVDPTAGPSGAQGTSTVFPAQKGAVGGPGNVPKPAPPQTPPPAPGGPPQGAQEPPPDEEQGPPQ